MFIVTVCVPAMSKFPSVFVTVVEPDAVVFKEYGTPCRSVV